MKPLIEIGWKTDPSNYGLVSFFQCISTITEKIAHEQVTSLLNKNNILGGYQPGFK